MTEYSWDFEDDEEIEEAEEAPKNPNLPKELRKVIANAKKAEKEAREEAATLRAQLRASTVASVLQARNVPEKVGTLIPDSVDASPDAIGKWLDEYGSLFGLQQTPVTDAGGQQQTAVVSPPPNANAAAMQQMQSMVSAAEPAGSYESELLRKISDPNLTWEQYNDLKKADAARQIR